MKKISKFAQYSAVILVLTITFANFGIDSNFPIKKIRNMTDEKLEEFLKNLQKQEKKTTALFDKTRITKAAIAASCTVILEAIIVGLIQKNSRYNAPSNHQVFTIITLTPFGCYLATDYLFDKFYGKKTS